jgi:dolichyl-phosphate beta-glucosyltransferase
MVTVGMAAFLSIVIPAYNEADRLPTTLRDLGEFLRQQSYRAEVVVVDDGSRDATAAVVQAAATSDSRIRLIASQHRGKGAAVRQGMLAATADVRVMCDADLSMPPDELPKLLAALNQGADVALATREGVGARRIGEPFHRHLMGRVFNLLVRALAVPGLQDTQCGFKAFTATAARTLFGQATVDGFGFDVEVLYLARKYGLRLQEVPIVWYYQSSSRVSPLRDTLRMVRDLLRVRWNDWRGRYILPSATIVSGR